PVLKVSPPPALSSDSARSDLGPPRAVRRMIAGLRRLGYELAPDRGRRPRDRQPRVVASKPLAAGGFARYAVRAPGRARPGPRPPRSHRGLHDAEGVADAPERVALPPHGFRGADGALADQEE